MVWFEWIWFGVDIFLYLNKKSDFDGKEKSSTKSYKIGEAHKS
jgi:hypothetical protein